MTFDDYQYSSRTTARYNGNGAGQGVVYNALKLAGEAGEISDKIGKKLGNLKDDEEIVFTPKEVGELMLEMGDVLWHLFAMATDLGISMQTVAEKNGDKLTDRLVRDVIAGNGDNR